MDDYTIVSLHCHECDNDSCPLCRIGEYVPEESGQGCTRKLDDDTYAEYEHINNEILPFLSLGMYKNETERVDEFLKYVYKRCPIGTVLDEKGKAIGTKKKIIDKYNSEMI